MVFIPKAGKTNHSKAKDYRPISLSSFMLKTFERLLDHHIRSKFNKNNISYSQHAYLKGKSCETALHEVVLEVESALQCNQYTLAAFLDIQGAFNNVTTSAIVKSLTNIGAEHPIKAWIVSMLNSRVIHSNIGCDKSLRYASRGTSQGGVISPLLWLLVVNEILLDLVKSRIKVVASADDVVILVSEFIFE